MELIRRNFKKIQKALSKIEVRKELGYYSPEAAQAFYASLTSEPITDKSETNEKLETNEELENNIDNWYDDNLESVKADLNLVELMGIEFYGGDGDKLNISDLIENVRKEFIKNISMPIDLTTKKSYLKEILNFYSGIEANLVEDEFGKLSCDLVRFVDTSFDSMIKFYKNQYEGFLQILKDSLQDEIKYVNNQIQHLEMKNTNITSAKQIPEKIDICWKRNKNDLIELVRALKLIGAINNSTNNITFDQAYKFFGDIFNIELKNPEDQLREAAGSYETPYFIEELLNIYMPDQKLYY